MGIILAVAALFVATLAGLPITGYLLFAPDYFPIHFWTPVTWPLATSDGGNPLALLFSLGWFYLFAGSLERAWGTRDFGTVLLATSVTMAILCWVGATAMHGGGILAGLGVVTGPLMVAWAVVNRREILTFFFLPIPAPVWGIIGVVLTWFHGGGGLSGLFLLPVCALMYWYVTRGRYGYPGGTSAPRLLLDDRDDTPAYSGSRPSRRNLDEGEPRPFNVLRWWRERREKKRLEDIFRRSGFTDEDDK